MKAYLAENHPEIEFGTVAFIDYLMGVMVEGADEELKSLPNYTQIRYYGGEYLHELDEAQVEMTESFEIYLTSDEFRAKTIGEIKEKENARMHKMKSYINRCSIQVLHMLLLRLRMMLTKL